MDNIFGIGTDIVDNSRIKKLFSKNKRFKKKIFSAKEIKHCESKLREAKVRIEKITVGPGGDVTALAMDVS